MSNCDKSFPVDPVLKTMTQDLADELGEICCCWRVNDSTSTGMPATAATIHDIIRSGGGVIDLSGGRWAIYSYDSVLGGNPVDFETYIYTGSGPPIIKSIVHSDKVSILNSCRLLQARPKTPKKTGEKGKSTIMRATPLIQPHFGLRAGSISRTSNWYKLAQLSNTFDPSKTTIKDLDGMTDEALAEGEKWAQDGVLENSIPSAQKPLADMLQNKEEMERKHMRAPSEAERGSDKSKSLSGLETMLSFLSSQKSAMDKIFVTIASTRGLSQEMIACPKISITIIPYNSVSGIARNIKNAQETVATTAPLANQAAIAADSKTFNIKTLQQLLPKICAAKQAIEQVLDQGPAMRTYLQSVVSNPTHKDYAAATEFLMSANTAGVEAATATLGAGITAG